jgi:uncharacterized protein YndB with AHSA1/START domain
MPTRECDLKYFRRAPELVLSRIVDAPRQKVFEVWSDPAHLAQWLAPAPWTVVVADADVRQGAVSMALVAKPQGEVMTALITFDDLGGRTRCTVRVRHWTSAESRVEFE